MISVARARMAALLLASHAFIQKVQGWKSYALAGGLGVLTAFAQAPYYFLPLLVIGFSGLIWLVDQAFRAQKPARHVFFLGWWFAFGYIYLGIYWLAFSFFHNAAGPVHFAVLAAIGFLGVAAAAGFIALFYGAALLIAFRFWHSGWIRIFAFAVFWSLAEYVRGHILTGFPWNLTGQAFAGFPVLSQLAALIGPYGLSLLTILLSVIPALMVRQDQQPDEAAARSVTLAPLAMLFGGMAVIVLFGWIRLSANPVEFVEGIRLQVVQPNVSQGDKINPDLYPQNFRASFDLSGGAAIADLAPVDELYVVWPENAAYDYFQRDPAVLELLADALPANATLLSGAIRVDRNAENGVAFYNSLHVIADAPLADEQERQMMAELQQSTRARQIIASYDKHHLAPFGEYVPFIGLFRALRIDRLVPLNDGLSRGSGPAVIDLGRTTVAPIICYETIFPGRMYPHGERPDWMVTVTNDAWFGDSVGPKQHLAQAQLRAVENGLAMVRSANTGISAVIDPYGRLLQSLPLLEQGTIQSGLPAPASPTVYSRIGDWTYFAMLIALISLVLRRSMRA